MLNEREKIDIKKRLRRTGGQISGIEKMVEEGRYCVDILQQIMAARAALNQVALIIIESHTKSCVVNAIKENRTEEAVDELMGVLSKFSK
ncbi:metal-sensitive transcriptional regulator [Sporomusa acidovorans]|uniref:Copper-sensing transcriptional repressor CsoR n=1 Tax=Sporomusa acidovorans (strain ATCC 49682 / DSM 3132 / Mol) TaxID=1123286 RepID=A0ABZ3J4Q5_SPOA4|nr:metal-sensitive transcriptional regulator [Sporomusa acidovorans]OZC23093.1 copper-sensing transcriptional repressor CsoR [Sporomusa acidovorans DSM 3132]SDF05257.1 DNA-binding transcriptional regulator, FrmR family [Sporomusa acidovorans]